MAVRCSCRWRSGRRAHTDVRCALARIGGRLTKVAFFGTSLVHSDAVFVLAFPRERTETFLEAHVAAFAGQAPH